MRKKDADQLCGDRELINALDFAKRIIHFLFFSSFYPASVNVQPAMCWTCSETTLLLFVFSRDGSYTSYSDAA